MRAKGPIQSHTHCLSAITALVLLCGCNLEYEVTEWENLSNEELVQLTPSSSIDFRGCENIAYKEVPWRDGYEAFWKATLPTGDLSYLLLSISGHPSLAEHQCDELSTIAEWPDPDEYAPEWWKHGRDDLENCHAFSMRFEEANRAKGWYLYHDQSTQTVYVWEWNHQWAYRD